MSSVKTAGVHTDFSANISTFTSRLNKAAAGVKSTSAKSARAFRQLDRQMKATRRTFQLTTRSLFDVRGALAGIGGVIATSLGIRELARAADTYTEINSRLKIVTRSARELAIVEAALFRVAQDTRQSFEATADLYGRLARSTQGLGFSQKELLDVTDSVNKAIILSGASASSAQAALFQLGQGLAAGALRGEELNSVMEQTPELARAIAEGLGVSIAKLREMGQKGELSAEKVIGALQKQREAIDRDFGSMGLTIAQSLTQLHNAFIRFIGTADKGAGVSAALASGIQWLARNFDRVAQGALAFGAALVAIKIGAFLTTLFHAANGLLLMARSLKVATLWSSALAAASATLAGAMALVTAPITLATAGIATLVAAGYLLIDNWQDVKAAAEAVWQAIKAAIVDKVADLSEALAKFIRTFNGDWADSMDAFADDARAGLHSTERAMKDAGKKIGKVGDAIADDFRDASSVIRDKLGDIVQWIKRRIGVDAPENVENLEEALADLQRGLKKTGKDTRDYTTLQKIADKAIKDAEGPISKYVKLHRNLKEAVRLSKDGVEGFNLTQLEADRALRKGKAELFGMSDAARRYRDQLNDLNTARQLGILNEQEHAGAVRTTRLALLRARAEQERTFGAGAQLAVAEYFDRLGDHAASAREFVAGAFRSLERTLSDFFYEGNLSFQRFTDAVKRGLADIAAKGVISVAGSIAKGALETVGGSIGSKIASTIFAAEGGYIRGPGSDRSDNIPAMLSPGEFVIKAASVRKYGRGFFHALNAGDPGPRDVMGLPGFGLGGFIKKAFKSVTRAVKKVAGFVVDTVKGTVKGLTSGDPLAIASIISSFVLPGVMSAVNGAIGAASAATAASLEVGGILASGGTIASAGSLSLSQIGSAISTGISNSFAKGILGGAFSPQAVASSLVSGAVGKAAVAAVSGAITGQPIDRSQAVRGLLAAEGSGFAKEIGKAFDRVVTGASPYLMDVPQFRDGGLVPKTGLARLHAGEFVLNSQAVGRQGLSNLQRLNAGRPQMAHIANDNVVRAITHDTGVQTANSRRLEARLVAVVEEIGALRREMRNGQGAARVAGVRAA